jgi:CHAD domain-containing protein
MRIQTKKLRYAVEAAEQSGVWQPPRLLKDLRRIQAVLGEAHDVQRLLDETAALIESTLETGNSVEILEQLWRAQLLDSHRAFLLERDRLRLICSACSAQAAQRRVPLPFRAA